MVNALSSAELFDPADWHVDTDERHHGRRTLLLTQRHCCPRARSWLPEELSAVILS